MKTTFWKPFAALVLALVLLFSATAQALARYPERGGVLTDDANALSPSIAADIAAYAQTVEAESGLKLNVVLVQFLDGETVQTYANTLFSRWALGESDLLLLGAAAEDSFAITAGAAVKPKLSEGSLKSLLYASGFAAAFQQQQYDAALGTFFPAFNTLLGKQYGVTVTLGNLFAAWQPQATTPAAHTNSNNSVDGVGEAVQGVVDATSSLWTDTLNSITAGMQDYQAYREQRDETRNGLTPAGWIVLVIIALIIFGQSGPARRARRNGGCGCGPLGWLVSLFGLGTLFSRTRDRQGRRDERRFERHGPGGFGGRPRGW